MAVPHDWRVVKQADSVPHAEEPLFAGKGGLLIIELWLETVTGDSLVLETRVECLQGRKERRVFRIKGAGASLVPEPEFTLMHRASTNNPRLNGAVPYYASACRWQDGERRSGK